jgi:hypothetical protein
VALEADLRAFKEAVGTVERDSTVRARPRVGPRLVIGFQPRHLARRHQPELSAWELLDRAGFFKGIKPEGPCPEGPKAPEGLGSSVARNSHKQVRHGFQGLTPPGRKNIDSSLRLLQERRNLLSFWTVTLPTGPMKEVARLDCWPRFVDRLLQLLRRHLEQALGFAIYVGVAELQEKRTLREGMPCPHLHIVFQGRRHSRAPWAASKESLDVMIAKAARYAGIEYSGGYASAGNVQQIRKSVRAYLGKYMTKGSSDARPWKGTEWEGLIPRQWWSWSDACRALVLGCTTDLPTGLVAWAWRNREALLDRGLFYLRQCKVPPAAPATYQMSFGNVANLAMVYALWQEWFDDELMMSRQYLGIYTQHGSTVYAKPLAG